MQTIAPATTGTHTYIINGKLITCTTSGTLTNYLRKWRDGNKESQRLLPRKQTHPKPPR